MDADRTRRAGWLVLIIVAVSVLYLPCVWNDFVNWDDDICVVNNDAVGAPKGLRRIWSTLELPERFPNYPLVFTMYWAERRVWGLQSAGYHATNVLLHACNTALVFVLVLTLGAGTWVSALTAALFAVHPMQVESVAWVSERKTVLSAFFYLGTFIAYLRFRQSGRRRLYVSALLLFACALLSKTTAVTLPLSILALERLRRGRWERADIVRTLPMFVMGALAGLLPLAVENRPWVMPMVTRVLIAATALGFYVVKLLAPLSLSPIYPRWAVSWTQVRWWLPLGGAVAVVTLVARYVREWRVRWGLTHFVCALLPVLGLRSYGFNEFSFVADRNVYLACMGLFLVAATGLDAVHRAAPRAGRLLVVAVLAVLLGLTWRQIPVWRDSVSLWTHVLATNPVAVPAHTNLALALINRGQLDEAAQHLRAALEIAPEDADAHTNLALIFLRRGDLAAAEGHARAAVAALPESVLFHRNLAVVLRQQGRSAEAIIELRHAQALDPTSDVTRNELGSALLDADLAREAADVFSALVQRMPEAAWAHYNLGLALRRLGRVEEARAEFEGALRLQPDFAAARDQLAALGARDS